MKKVFQYICYVFYRIAILFFRLTPFKILYLISDFFAFFMFRILRYRVKVVDKNLEMCFPEKPKAERDKIKKKYYTYMVDLMLESLKGYSYPAKKLRKRFVYTDNGIMENFYKQNKSVIIAMGHCGNWEWGSQTAHLEFNHKFAALFKPMHNPFINAFTMKCRENHGMHLCPIEKTRFLFSLREKYPVGIIMLGDQNTSNIKRADWVDFFGMKTGCLPGIEFYSKMFDMPIVFAEIQRTRRGFYKQSFHLLTDNPNSYPKGGITQLYMSKLEEIIRANPVEWLWSHKRWKAIKDKNGEVHYGEIYKNL